MQGIVFILKFVSKTGVDKAEVLFGCTKVANLRGYVQIALAMETEVKFR